MSEGWANVPLGEVLRHRKEFIRIDDLMTYKRCRVQLHAQGVVLRDTVAGAEIKTKAQQKCRAGEFLVAEIDAKHGGYGIVPAELAGAIVSSHYFLFGVDDSRLDRRFLGYYIRTPAFREQIEAQGSTNYAAIRPAHVLEYTAPLPPLAEQRRIVARIEALAERIAEAKRLRDEASQEAARLISASVTATLASIEHNAKLGDVLTGPPRNGWSARCDGLDDGVPVLSLGAVTGFNYRSGQFKRTSQPTAPGADYWLKEGDLLMTRSNTPDLVGHAALYTGQPSPCIYPDLMMRLEIEANRVDKRFVHYWLQSRVVRDFVKSKAKGTSPTMKKISQGVVMLIPFPGNVPLAEQRRVVAYLDNLRGYAQTLQHYQAETAAELDALLPSVLADAFAGRL